MSGNNEIIETVAKLLPLTEIYKDGAQPAVRQVGKLGEDVLKALRLALLPVQAVAAIQDKVEALIKESVNRVPAARLITPPPQIIGPVLEAIRYEPLDSAVGQMFSDLLSSSMDTENVSKAHPAYPLIVRQLSSDEAVILKLVYEKTYEFVSTSKLRPDNRFQREAIEVDELPRTNLAFSDRVDFYMGHLSQLGLAGIYEYKNQEPLYADVSDTRKQTGVRVFSRYQLTSFGREFMGACLYGKK